MDTNSRPIFEKKGRHWGGPRLHSDWEQAVRIQNQGGWPDHLLFTPLVGDPTLNSRKWLMSQHWTVDRWDQHSVLGRCTHSPEISDTHPTGPHQQRLHSKQVTQQEPEAALWWQRAPWPLVPTGGCDWFVGIILWLAERWNPLCWGPGWVELVQLIRDLEPLLLGGGHIWWEQGTHSAIYGAVKGSEMSRKYMKLQVFQHKDDSGSIILNHGWLPFLPTVRVLSFYTTCRPTAHPPSLFHPRREGRWKKAECASTMEPSR